MNELYSLIIGAIFIYNFVLIKFLGICPFIGVSKNSKPAIGMGIAVTFVMTLASLFSWLIYNLFLVRYNLEYLQIVTFIFVIASLVQIVEIFIKRYSVKLYNVLGIYLPLITTNCAVLAVTFMNVMENYNFIYAIIHGLAAGVGFTLVLFLMSAIRERLDSSDVPRPFRGVPIAFITGALMSIAFLGFAALR